MRRLAAFLDIPIAASRWDAMLEHCSFAYMKQHAARSVPLGGIFWEGGAQTFINQGTNGRWRDTLRPEESAKYERLALQRLGAPCARWLATGVGADEARPAGS